MRKMTMMMACVTLQGVCVEPALAQDTAQEAGGLEEIVVTAQRRSENLQETPLAVTAISSATLATQGIDSLADLASQVPALQTGESGQVFLRGVGSTNLNETGDQAVAFHIDGVYIARAQAATGLLFDVDRVEVLRGPQGTLYGRNATVGAINVISKRPTDNFEGLVSADVGNYGAQQYSGVLNVPLGSVGAVRAALQTARHEGYIKNINDGVNDAYDQDDRAARVSALFNPSDSLSIYVAADVLQRRGASGANNGGSNSSAAFMERVGTQVDPWVMTSTIPTKMDDDYAGFTAEVNWQIGPGTVTYLGGYRTEERDERGQSFQAAGFPQATIFKNDDSTDSHELRYSGAVGSFNWVTGLYYFAEDNAVDFRVNPYTGTGRQFDQGTILARSKAAFAQGTYALIPELRLTAGLRYTEDRKARDGVVNVLTNGVPTSVAAVNVADYTWNKLNWKVGLDYDVSDSVMAYVTVATGYKAGGYYDGLPPNSYEPEEILSYEVGLKSRYWENRFELNASAYYYDYTDFQASSQVFLTPTIPAGATVNADEARIMGVDLESKLQFTPNDRIEFSVGYLDAEYVDFYLPNGDGYSNAGLPNTAPRVPADFSDTPMAKAPEWTINLGYEHVWDIANGATITARLQSHYESSKYLEYHHYPFDVQDSFTRSDAMLTFTSAQGMWSVMGYVRNIEDDDVMTSAFPLPLAGGPQYTVHQYASPQLYGVRATVNF